jgi:hypothetical protein
VARDDKPGVTADAVACDDSELVVGNGAMALRPGVRSA